MPLIPPKNSAADAAQRIRQIVTQVGRQATGACQRINRIVQIHGRSDVLAALGVDAVDLLTFHDDIAKLALKYTDVVIDPLPEDQEPEAPKDMLAKKDSKFLCQPKAPADPA